MLLWIAWIASMGCTANSFRCPVDVAYDDKGQMDSTSYRVKTECFKGMNKRIDVCYGSAK